MRIFLAPDVMIKYVKSICFMGLKKGFPGGAVVENPPANAGDIRDPGSIPGVGRFPWRREWQPTPLFLPRKFHGQGSWWARWSCKESDTTEWLSMVTTQTHTYTNTHTDTQTNTHTHTQTPTDTHTHKEEVTKWLFLGVMRSLWRKQLSPSL